MHRKNYNDKINSLLKPFGIIYDGNGNKIISEDFYKILDGKDEKTKEKRVKLAIKRARRNYNNLLHTNIAKEESSTTVFKLVEKLLKHI